MTRSRDIADQQDNLGGAVAPFVAGKNKVINGDFGVWQRGTTFSPTSAAQIYLADRWAIYQNGSGTFTVSQQTFTAGTAPVAGYESQYFTRLAITTLGTTTAFEFEQKIEDVRTFAGQTVTFSFWAKSPSSTAIAVYFRQNFGSGGSANVQTAAPTVFLTTSWQRFTYTVAIPSVAGKTIGAGSHLETIFLGSTAANQSWDIWGVQVEAGSQATPFTTASGSIGGELALCQRYYVRFANESTFPSAGPNSGLFESSTSVLTTVALPVTMRTASGDLTYSGVEFSDGPNAFVPSAITINTAGKSYPRLKGIVSGATTSRPAFAYLNGANAYLAINSEL